MNDLSSIDPVSACSSLAERALSGAREIESILVERTNEIEAPEFQKLRLLASKLQKLSKDADELRTVLQAASAVSAALQTALSIQLPVCDATAASVNKQLLRLGKNTPRDAINTAAILQYESFVESTTRLLLFVVQLLSIDSVNQQAKLEIDNGESLLAEVAFSCQETASSSGILLDTETSSHNVSSDSGTSDTRPPAYLAYEASPPSFEEQFGSIHAEPVSAAADVGGSSSQEAAKASSGGFLNSLASPFKALTTSMWSSPGPLVATLCQAAATGNVVQLRFLLAEGAGINGRNENGQAALICAILASQLDAVKFLLKEGADPQLCDAGRKGKPPLFHAIDTKNRAAVDLLLEHGADANQGDSLSQPYFVTLVTGETAVEWIALLLSHGADASAKDVSWRSLVILAMQKRKKVEDREEVVRLLLRHGAKPDTSDMDGTPLTHLCMQQKRPGLVHDLLALGADPNARDVSGRWLLATALKRNDRQLVKVLLERGADPNVDDIYDSPLILAVLRDGQIPPADRAALAEMLLEHGARGDKEDSRGVTALEHSLTPTIEGIADIRFPEGANFKISELLLKQGADPNQRLIKAPGKPTLLVFALERNLQELAALALRHGANANMVDKNGCTPLLQAVQTENMDMVALLIQHGAHVNQPSETLPLNVAMAAGRPEIIELLKAHGAV